VSSILKQGKQMLDRFPKDDLSQLSQAEFLGSIGISNLGDALVAQRGVAKLTCQFVGDGFIEALSNLFECFGFHRTATL